MPCSTERAEPPLGTGGYPDGVSTPVTPARWLRAAALGVTSVGLAAGGHIAAGGHVEPVFAGLLVVAAVLASHGWLRRERGLVAITAAVGTVQIAVHLGLTVGHSHNAGPMMIGAHAAMALVLAAFLRSGEARIHAAARRRYLAWLVAVRLLIADLPRPLPSARRIEPVQGLHTLWTPTPGPMRGPPAPAFA